MKSCLKHTVEKAAHAVIRAAATAVLDEVLDEALKHVKFKPESK